MKADGGAGHEHIWTARTAQHLSSCTKTNTRQELDGGLGSTSTSRLTSCAVSACISCCDTQQSVHTPPTIHAVCLPAAASLRSHAPIICFCPHPAVLRLMEHHTSRRRRGEERREGMVLRGMQEVRWMDTARGGERRGSTRASGRKPLRHVWV